MNTTEIISTIDTNRLPPDATRNDNGTVRVRRIPSTDALLPYIPRKRQERSGLLADYIFLPAAENGTDYLDFLLLGENRFGVILADFSGASHSVDAEETIPLLKLALRSKSAGLSAAATLRYLDQHVAELAGEDELITALYLIFDQSKRLLHFASAGHLPMLLHRPCQNQTFLLTASGAPFGHEVHNAENSGTVNGINQISGESVALGQGDLVVLYNSGLLKQRSPQGEYFGRQRLIDCLRKYSEANPAQFLAELEKRLEDFVDGQAQQYDAVVMALKNTLRDLERPAPETIEHAVGNRFLHIEDEQIILDVIREHPRSPLADVADQLAQQDLKHVGKEKLQTYLSLTSHWLAPVPSNGHAVKNGEHKHNGTNGTVAEKTPPTRRTLNVIRQLQREMVEAFPIRHALSQKFDFLDESPAWARAKEFYTNGDYQQALLEVSTLRDDVRSSTDLHCFIGNLYLFQNMATEAKEEYQHALTLDQRISHAHLAMSYIALLQEDFCTAIDEFSTALRLDRSLQDNNPLLQQLITAAEKRDNRSEWLV